MGCYTINDKKAIRQVEAVMTKLGLKLDLPWKYDPHFLIGVEKGRIMPDPKYHQRKWGLEKLSNEDTFEEV